MMTQQLLFQTALQAPTGNIQRRCMQFVHPPMSTQCLQRTHTFIVTSSFWHEKKKKKKEYTESKGTTRTAQNAQNLTPDLKTQ